MTVHTYRTQNWKLKIFFSWILELIEPIYLIVNWIFQFWKNSIGVLLGKCLVCRGHFGHLYHGHHYIAVCLSQTFLNKATDFREVISLLSWSVRVSSYFMCISVRVSLCVVSLGSRSSSWCISQISHLHLCEPLRTCNCTLITHSVLYHWCHAPLWVSKHGIYVLVL